MKLLAADYLLLSETAQRESGGLAEGPAVGKSQNAITATDI